MPDLTQTVLGQNYRRVRVGNSQLGTRQLQMYEIHIYGLSDVIADNDNVYEGSREIVLDGTDNMDQPPIAELASGNIVEAILRGVQEMAEIYMVGHVDYYNYDPDDNELVLTVIVSADTVESNWEGYLNYSPYNPNSQTFYDAIGNSVDQWAYEHSENWVDLDVYPAVLVGNGTDTWGPFALAKTDPAAVAVKDAQKAKNAVRKAIRMAARQSTGFPARMKRPS